MRQVRLNDMSQHARNNPDQVPVRMDRFRAPTPADEREIDEELADELEEKRASSREDIEQEREAWRNDYD